MKIVIGGAGAVGSHLARLLSRERHDLTVMDVDPARLSPLADSLDIMTQAASPTSPSGLQAAGAKNADLFIAVMPEEEANLNACMYAKKMGTKRTVARVNTPELMEAQNKSMLKEMGVDEVILPEMIAAREIADNVSRSWIRQWWMPEDSQLVMLGVKVREGAPLLHRKLKDLGTLNNHFHIVAIKRGGETIIPHGEDELRSRDLAFFMTTQSWTQEIRQLAGKENYPEVKNVTILGGGLTAVLTTKFLPENIRIKILEKDESRLKQLFEQTDERRVMIIHGDGRDMELLRDENIGHTEAFIALTGHAETNILSCLAAQRMGIRKTVAMLDNLTFANMAERLDIGSLINKQAIAASYIYRMLLKADVTNVKNLMVANADVAEFIVKEKAKVTRHAVKDLRLPEGSTLGGLVRHGQSMLINGMTQLEAGDRVVVFCTGNDLRKISSFF